MGRNRCNCVVHTVLGGLPSSDVAALLAAVAAPGGVLVALLERSRRQNARDHDRNYQLLTRIESKVDTVDGRLHEHLADHWRIEADRTQR